MESEPRTQSQESSKLSRASRLRIFTKLLREPIVVSGSAYRSGAHPVLATRVAVEVSRSPKRGLVQQLMAESRQAFLESDYPTAIVKSLAAEELLRKYGGILLSQEQAALKEQLQFLKIQYFLLSGQAGEAYRVLQSIRHRSHPYLWHRRMASRSGVRHSHWLAVEKTLRLFFQTGRSGKIFALLGYAIVMGPEPDRALSLADELDFEPDQSERIYQPLCTDYLFLTTRVTRQEKHLFPEYLATECKVTPLIKEGQTLFLGSASDLSTMDIDEIEVRVGAETVIVPMTEKPVKERNARLYAS